MRKLVISVALAFLGIAQPTPRASWALGSQGATGYDVSYLDCETPLPESFGFALVNVNDGRPLTQNPCLDREVQWASGASSDVRPRLSFYMNTSNPGPLRSAYWPVAGTLGPEPCDGSWDAACAYDFGWTAGADAYRRVLEVVEPAIAVSSEWWLDVETANRWSPDQDMNVWALLGSVDGLRVQGVRHIGIYATRAHWQEITGASAPDSPTNAPFASMPNWIPRLGPIEDAEANCTAAQSLTGGPVELVQFEFFLDKNYACGG